MQADGHVEDGMWAIHLSRASMTALLLFAAVAACGQTPDGTPTQSELTAGRPRGHAKAAPDLTAPDDGATLSTARPTLRWTLARGHRQAVVEICSDSACTTVIDRLESRSGEVHPDSPLPDGKYYWRAAWANDHRHHANWSEVRTLTILVTPLVVTEDLFAVWAVARDNVWVVGKNGTILHFDGIWRAEKSPVTENLGSIWMGEDGRGWAAGDSGTILHRSDGIWTVVPCPTSQNLSGVWASADDDAWVAYSNAGVLHWDGASWTVHYPGDGRPTTSYSAISGRSADDVTVVGRGTVSGRAGVVVHWDGASWTETEVCQGPLNMSKLFGALSDVWAVKGGSTWATGVCQPSGAAAYASYVVRGDEAGNWSGQHSAIYRYSSSVWASADDDVWVGSPPGRRVSFAGSIEHYDGQAWTASPQAITANINGLGGTAPDDVWAVGPGGKRLHYDGYRWATPARGAMELERHDVTLTGSWDGTTYWYSGVFTVSSSGPVDASATVAADGTARPVALALLGVDPDTGQCGEKWLPASVPSRGVDMLPPTVTGDWYEVPAGTYCMSVVATIPSAPPPRCQWTVTITSP